VVATLERQARKGDTIALDIRREDVSYPYFGSRLDRHVEFVTAAPTEADWLVVAPGEKFQPPGYRRLPTGGHGWRLFRRS
jgi:hypothetical protein